MYSIPSDFLYTKDHEWIKIENENYTLGITDYAQKKLSDVVYVDISYQNKQLEPKQIICSLESVKAVSEVYSPIACDIISFNESLSNKPELINTHPYQEGWICKLKPQNISDLQNLMKAEEYKLFTEKL